MSRPSRTGDFPSMRRLLPLLLVLLALPAVLLVGCSSATAPPVPEHFAKGEPRRAATPAPPKAVAPLARPKLAGLAPVTVKATPTGPTAPAGGWHMVFADGFGAKIGTGAGEDKFWYPNESTCCAANVNKHAERSNDLNAYNSSQVKVSASGLELTDEYSPGALAAGTESGTTYPVRNYVSGAASTNTDYEAGGYKGFTWEPNGGETWAMECYCEMPENPEGSGFTNSGEDASFWSLDKPWHVEFDFFEEWGWGTCNSISTCLIGFAWIYDTGNGTGKAKATTETWRTLQSLKPTTTFHRYTILIKPENTWEIFIDGTRQCGWEKMTECHLKPPYVQTGQMHLNLSHAIAAKEGSGSGATPTTYPQFVSGHHTFTARSVQVWEDEGHKGLNVTGGGVATGTVVEGGGEPEEPTPPATGPKVGAKLVASTGTWTNTPTGFTYKWRRCNTAGASCVTITGATSSKYTVVTADVGKTLRVAVTAANAFGSATQESAATGTIRE